MGKRMKRLTLGIVCFMMMLAAVPVQAQTLVNKSFMVEQAKAKAPNVKLYITGSSVGSDLQLSGADENIEFVQSGESVCFKDSGEGIRYIFLLDNSGSINKAQFNETKLQLEDWRKKLNPQDEMQLYTVGTVDILSEKADVFGKTVKGSDSSANKDVEAIENIEYISNSAGKTILYRSLNEILEEQGSQSSMDSLRTVVIIVTDGEDDSDDVNGKDNDRQTTLENVVNSSIPVYGIVLNNTLQKKNEEKILFTKNKLLNSDNSNGYYYNCATETTGEVVTDAFTQIKKVLYEDTYIVNLAATTNKKIVERSELAVTTNSQNTDTVSLDYSDYEEDYDAPVVVGSVSKEGKNVIKFTLEDKNGVNLSDAKDKTHYTVSVKGNKKHSKEWVVAQAGAVENGDQVTVTLTMKNEEFYNQTYNVTINGIHDNSEEQNKMNKVKIKFTVEDGLNPTKEAVKDFFQSYWWIFLIVIVIGIGVAVVFIVKKKSVKIVEVNPEELSKADSKLIRLTITDRTGAIKDIEWDVEGSLFVGRSDICNIFFDDDRLSRQHFVIEVTKMGCYIEDLETTNGTFVNGVKITTKRLLLDGDIITAGREKITFHMDKAPVYEDEN